MKTRAVMKAWRVIASGVLLAGLLYSVLALTAKPVYASGCDCFEARQDAEEICSAYGGLRSISCNSTSTTVYAFCYEGVIPFPCSY